jgi:hypothetical protein
MKFTSITSLMVVGLSALLGGACGHSSVSSQLNNTSHDACVAAANSQKTQAYGQAAKDFEAAASACYAVMDDNHYIPVSICLKKAEASRKEALAKADQTWKDAMSVCEPR